jgi:predicted ribosome quality control (RQC) complex YloA/Tae2 family protein
MKNLGDLEVVRGLARFLSVGGLYSEELLLRARVDKTKPCGDLNQVETDAIFMELTSLLARTTAGSYEPCIVLDEAGSFVDVLPFKLERYEGVGFMFQPFSSFNEALDEF